MTDECKAKWARRMLSAGIIIILFLPLLVAKGFLLPFNTGKVLVFRAVVDILLAPMVWLILSVGWRKIFFHPLTFLWGLLLATRILAGVVGVDPYQSFWGELDRTEGLITEIHVWMFMLMVLTAFVSGFKTKTALAISVGAALLVFVDALLLEKAKLVYMGVISQRSSGTIGNPAFLAVYLSFNSFFALYLAVLSNKRIYRIASGVASGVLGAGVLLTQTRSSAVPFLTVIALLAASLGFIYFRRITSLRQRLVFLGAVLLVLTAVVVFFPGIPSRFSRLTSLSLSDGSMINRVLVWKIDLEAVMVRPLLGWGPENQLIAFYKHYDPAARRFFTEIYDRAHNMIIDTATSSGILGLASTTALHVSWVAILVRQIRRRKGKEQVAGLILGGAYLSYIISNQFLFEQITTWIPLVLLAGVTAAGYESHRLSPSENFPRAIPIAAGAIGAVFFVFFAVIPAAALTYGAAARRYLDIDLSRSIDLYKKAYSFNTFANREMVKELAIELITEGDLSGESIDKDVWKRGAGLAEAVLRDEMKRHPYAVSMPNILAKLEDVRWRLELSGQSRALELLEELHRSYPNLIDTRWDLALHRIRAGQIDAGVRLLEETAGMVHSYGFDQQFGNGYIYLGLGYFLANRPADAEVALRLAEKLNPGLSVEIETARERIRLSKKP